MVGPIEKNSNAGEFVLTYQLIHENFRLVQGPVFCPVSGFCTSSGHIEKNLCTHRAAGVKHHFESEFHPPFIRFFRVQLRFTT